MYDIYFYLNIEHEFAITSGLILQSTIEIES